MKKKLIVVIIGIIATLGILSVIPACSSSGELKYSLSEDGTYYLVSAANENVTDEMFNNMPSEYSEEIDPESGEMINALPVKAIDIMGFMGCSKLRTIKIPNFIEFVGYSAFAYCTGLRSVTFSSNMTEIPYGIFGGCRALLTVEIPDNITKINEGAFYLSGITSIVVPETVVEMGWGCFERCEYLERAEIYANIDTLPYYTFFNCCRLGSVTLTSSIKEIKGYDVFNSDGEIITDEEIEDDEDVVYAYPAFYYSTIVAGSNNISFEYEVEEFRYMGTATQLSELVVGDYNVCLTESTKLTVYCLDEYGNWMEANWRFS